MKLATDVPDPPPITSEMLEELKREAVEWRKAIAAAARAMENLTAEDLRTRCR